MTPLPKRRHSTRRQGKRRAALKLVLPELLKCPNCGSFRIPHRACEFCGYYNGKQVIKIKETSKSSAKGGSASGRKKS